MTLLRRISTLFKADMHAMLDHIEDPQALLQQSLREMDAVIQEQLHKQQSLEKDCLRLNKQIEATRSELSRYEEELDLCFAQQQDELAKNIVARKLTAELRLQTGLRQLEESEAQQEELVKRLAEMQQQYRQLQQQAEVFVDEAAKETVTSENLGVALDAHAIEVAFLKEKQKRANS
ncbi:PspA/IM30 family protein [Pleionea sp. CnH1-48]|uniref:PspA/IM30 family protein n=1 Tax=Pleionea sp. CnH1-48 TaxID=2954494 RepID=UPI0020970E4A|nr:PspA/IM30 family protein [Pleionea sp. CnH1-48]MCO7222812.1 PspA/IM30 family protein [Pleionea sp. CnH1-48]